MSAVCLSSGAAINPRVGLSREAHRIPMPIPPLAHLPLHRALRPRARRDQCCTRDHRRLDRIPEDRHLFCLRVDDARRVTGRTAGRGHLGAVDRSFAHAGVRHFRPGLRKSHAGGDQHGQGDAAGRGGGRRSTRIDGRFDVG